FDEYFHAATDVISIITRMENVELADRMTFFEQLLVQIHERIHQPTGTIASIDPHVQLSFEQFIEQLMSIQPYEWFRHLLTHASFLVRQLLTVWLDLIFLIRFSCMLSFHP